jgi:unsaturated rhamnogalacturonyl hydrolase
MRVRFIISILFFCVGALLASDTIHINSRMPWSKRIADSFLARHPNAVTYDTGFTSTKWTYEQGLMLTALLESWKATDDQRSFEFVQRNLEQYIDTTGAIRTYKLTDFNLDNVAGGLAVLTLYETTNDRRYKYAADSLRLQLKNQPRTASGGFWHKKIYPYQMWLDGLYMAEPFYAKYAKMFAEPQDYDDIANQFILIATKTLDPKTGLFYHAWDEQKRERWASPQTGCSPNFWGRSIGWFAMALVDVLDYLPQDHSSRQQLVTIFQNLAETLLRYRDAKSHIWYQVVDQGDRQGNYLEASSTCMFIYAIAKGANNKYIDQKYLVEAERSFEGVIQNLVTIDSDGLINLHHICKGAGLGGTPYRDGSFNYYISEQQRTNDIKGVGPFLLAAIELERNTLRKKNIEGKSQ